MLFPEHESDRASYRSTLLNFITTNVRASVVFNTLKLMVEAQVLHTQILKFHEEFRKAKSLDEMIRLQNEQ